MGARGDEVEQLVVSKDGYLDAKVSVVRDVRFFPVFLDALLLCIPCLVDDASNAATTVTLFPDTVRLVRKLYIPEQAPRLALLEPSSRGTWIVARSLAFCGGGWSAILPALFAALWPKSSRGSGKAVLKLWPACVLARPW
jgi:hypothetical protein